ncbi:hypothetical protein [Allostreptomyces psammosilenae]|uniref:Formylglycine-generating enzyme required for sulfatase activity n=1 Tax=Allostreptomyces psammosilenae TaxID=1892865 RepID=A0A852ZZT6_9ACTN|nr:hypothetical protein [Allostreptomyces psammosilenae]NYI03782.1 formylglycine-generating enzyme required for sulfatase activity [Allostreptomyces psammosilenae]
MVRKKMEGDEEQRRQAARGARATGHAPSEAGTTTGASKQRHHLRGDEAASHEERLRARERGKQHAQTRPTPPPGPAAQEPRRTTGVPTGPGDLAGRGSQPEMPPEHQRVFQAVAEAESAGGGAVHLDEVARTADMPKERTREVLGDLLTRYRVVQELARADEPDLGARYQIAQRA